MNATSSEKITLESIGRMAPEAAKQTVNKLAKDIVLGTRVIEEPESRERSGKGPGMVDDERRVLRGIKKIVDDNADYGEEGSVTAAAEDFSEILLSIFEDANTAFDILREFTHEVIKSE